MYKSPRQQFLDLIAPRWRIPCCTVGNIHNAGLCMGSTVPENLGRRYFYVCDWPFQPDLCKLNLISVMLVVRAVKCVLRVRTQSSPFFPRPPRLVCTMRFKFSVMPWRRDPVFRQLQPRALPLSKPKSALHAKLPTFQTVSLILLSVWFTLPWHPDRFS